MEETKTKQSPLYTAKYILFAVLFAAFIFFIIFIASYIQQEFSRVESANAEKSQKSPTIVIDAGHGGEDGGTSGGGVVEKDLNLSIAKDLADMLRAAGFEVVLTREDDRLLYDPLSDYKGRKKQLDLAERLRIGESIEDAVFVSIHMNAFPIEKYSGLQVYYSSKNDSSLTLANEIQTTVKEYLQIDNTRQEKSAGAEIFVLDRTQIPAILIECGFLSNNEECVKLSDTEYQKKLALTIFLAISKYIDQTLD